MNNWAHYARFGLEPNPDPSVDDALRAALGKLHGQLLVGVIDSIGMRRDTKAVGALSDLLKDSDLPVASAAAAALGRIHTMEACEALHDAYESVVALRPALGDAGLTAGDLLQTEGKKAEAIQVFDAIRQAELPKHIRTAALQRAILVRGAEGLAMALECLNSNDRAEFAVGLATVQKLPGNEVTLALLKKLKKLLASGEASSDLRPALVVDVVAARGDRSALPAIVELAQQGPAAVRLAAVRALARLGDASVVPVLLEVIIASPGDLAQAAQGSLAALPDKEIDAVLMTALGQSQGTQLVAVIEVVGLRGIAAATPTLEKLADRGEAAERTAAINSLALTIGPDRLPALIDRMVKAKTPETAAVVRESLRKACLRMPDRDACAGQLVAAMAQAPVAAQGQLLSLLGVVGGEAALKAVTQAAKEGKDEIQDNATKTLGEWMSPDAAPALLELASSGQSKYALRALRGYIRIARQFSMPPQERLVICHQAMPLCGRVEEKKLVLELYTRVPLPEALAELTPYLNDAELKETAAASAVAIGQKIAKEHPAVVAATMAKVLEATSNADVKTKAKALLEQTQK